MIWQIDDSFTLKLDGDWIFACLAAGEGLQCREKCKIHSYFSVSQGKLTDQMSLDLTWVLQFLL